MALFLTKDKSKIGFLLLHVHIDELVNHVSEQKRKKATLEVSSYTSKVSRTLLKMPQIRVHTWASNFEINFFVVKIISLLMNMPTFSFQFQYST
jgi:hypothetical protein